MGLVPRTTLRLQFYDGPDMLRSLFLHPKSRWAGSRHWLFQSAFSRLRAPDKLKTVPAPNTFVKHQLSFTTATTSLALSMKYSGRSLRSEGLSAAYTVGVPKEVAMRLSNHRDEKVFFRHYVDPLMPPSEAAGCFYGPSVVGQGCVAFLSNL